MNGRGRRLLAGMLLLVAMAVGAVVLWVELEPSPYPIPDRPPLEALVLIVSGLSAFTVVGALLAIRRPELRMAWVLCALGVVDTLGLVCFVYADATLLGWPGILPGGSIAASIASWGWSVCFLVCPATLMLVFPTGRLSSRPARAIVLDLVAGVAGLAVADGVRAGPLAGYPAFANPFGLLALSPDAAAVARGAGTALLACGVLGSALSLAWRLRRAAGVERQQLKWFAFAAALAGGSIVASIVLQGPASDVTWIVGLAGLLALPCAIGLAVLRYRLYEIDRIISRTVAFALLTGALAAVYVGSVLLLQALFAGLVAGRGGGLTVAISTLLVAALFRPARRRIAGWAERRFDRPRYDAARTVEAFGERLRSEIDLEQVTGELLAIVDATMRPSHLGLWVRDSVTFGGRSPGRTDA